MNAAQFGYTEKILIKGRKKKPMAHTIFSNNEILPAFRATTGSKYPNLIDRNPSTKRHAPVRCAVRR